MNAKPFLKWVGGKTQLLDDIKNNLPDNLNSITTYIEPFIGGGATLFNIIPLLPNVKHVIINDLNYKLINVYNVIKYQHTELIKYLEELQSKYYSLDSIPYKIFIDEYEEIGPCLPSHYEIRKSDKEQMYLKIRDSFNEYELKTQGCYVKHAAEFIFLNKTCFNGLYRENSKGMFNVGWNKSKKPLICDKDNIIAVHEFLNRYNVSINTGVYQNILNNIGSYKNTLVYLDPPYRPITDSAAFTAYTKSGFNDNDQKILKQYCDKINDSGNYFMLSNSDPKNSDVFDMFFDDLYDEYNIIRVNARRSINSKGDKRGAITEILVKNF